MQHILHKFNLIQDTNMHAKVREYEAQSQTLVSTPKTCT